VITEDRLSIATFLI